MSTTGCKQKNVLVRLQSKTTKFTVHAGTTSRQQSHQRALVVSLPFYCCITLDIAPHPHGSPVRRDHVPTVLPCMWSHYRGFPAVTAVFPLSPLLCRPLLRVMLPTVIYCGIYQCWAWTVFGSNSYWLLLQQLVLFCYRVIHYLTLAKIKCIVPLH